MKRPSSPKEYRKKRPRYDKELENTPCPKEINTIQDLILFSYTYKGAYIDTHRLQSIIPYLQELDNMIGLEDVKKNLLYMIMHFCQGNHRKNIDYLHMIICGAPGCGKTSLGKIIGKILSKLEILSKDIFTIIKITDLIAKYVGQTVHRTRDILEKSLGGVVFIDEAYSLSGQGNQYAREALDLLNQFLSEHKDDFVCIIAGYEEQLETTFFSTNPGLKSRFPWRFIIKNYNGNDLYKIFLKILEQHEYTIEKNSMDTDFFTTNIKYFTYSGRDIETFITKCKYIHTRNTFGKHPTNILTKKDITDALEEFKKHTSVQEQHPIPYGMYI